MSSLSDSAAYMRGSKNGYEVKLRDDAPHLLQIDGDACHHIHNITKHFSSELDPENHLAHLIDDINRDFHYSPDIKSDFLNICKILGVPDKQPKERVAHRWMSLLDSALSLDELADPLTVLYYSWLNTKDRALYKDTIIKIFRNYKVSDAGRQTIYAAMRTLKLKEKNMSPKGVNRKQRVCVKIIYKRKITDLLTKAVIEVFPRFKNFILAFETKRPMLHKLHDRMVQLFRDFLKYFIKAQEIRASGKKLKELNLCDKTKHIPIEHIPMGKCEDTLTSCSKEDILKFRTKLHSSFISTAKYMQKKLPLSNTVLSTLSLLDPLAFGQTETGILLKKLPDFFPTIDAPGFSSEIMDMQADVDIVAAEGVDLDVWWSSVFKLNRYPSVEKVVTACLSIFTGPRVEQSFSMMNNIISSKTSSLLVTTYEAILFIKYLLLAQKTTAIKQTGAEHTLEVFMSLARELPNVIKEEELGALDSELRQFVIDDDVSMIDADSTISSDVEFRLDTSWWTPIFHLTLKVELPDINICQG
ncbi:hypothetical protein EGW08_010595 [Elysia chlorotica]|uniref:HAT C-terminal dimerisation domain-containing protein n=1 Tax=Elysia chlorotica TaxID=188477 RepID=A0A3S1BEB4_ELYCH|nr:hypothetical protein EGW08_010595 [Elysia chlorotica]